MLNLIEELKELTQLKSFIGHLGRPGKRGGSLPKGATAAPAAPSAPVQEIIWGKVSLGKSSTRKGAFRLVADMFGSDWYEKGYRIWKWQDEQHIVKVNPRKRKAAAAIEPVADKPKSEFFEGDFGSSTIKQIYNNSSERVKRLADQTGLLACDEIAYSYIKDELKQDARSLVNVADLQYGFSGTYGYYGSKMKFLDNWRTSGSPGNQYFRSHDKWDIDLLQNFAHAGKIPNKDYLRGPELQSLTELGDKYNFPKPDAYISRYDLASEDVDALKQLAMRAWWRAAFVRGLYNDGTGTEERREIKQICKEIFEKHPWDDTTSAYDYFQKIVQSDEFEDKLGKTVSHPTSVMAALKSADAMVRQQLSDGVQNSFDHNVHHFNVELKHAFQVHVADPILKAYAKMRDTKDNENTETQYHGTDYGGAIGIVRTGYNLKFTKNGRMLGNGTYVTPVSSKSLQYLMGHVGRGDGRGILFVNKISWGRIKENGSYSYSYEPFDSTHASKSGSLRNDESCIHNPKCLYPEYWLDMQRIGQPW